jgi:hypothetical protein
MKSGNIMNCPYCKAEMSNITDEEKVARMMKRTEANDAGSMMVGLSLLQWK